MMKIGAFFSNMKGSAGKIWSDPQTDWRLALAGFLIGALVVMAIDALFFFGFSMSESDIVASDMSSLTIDRKDINEAIGMIRKDDTNSPVIPETVKKDQSRTE